MEEEPRIGVFICHCGVNIGGVVNVPEVAEYAKTLPNVTYAEDNLYTCSEAGIAANIREQCSWVHPHEPERATEKAKDIVRMAVARATWLQPLEEPELEIKDSALIIGAGIAGMTAALTLAHQGFRVHLVEKEAEVGGNLRRVETFEGSTSCIQQCKTLQKF